MSLKIIGAGMPRTGTSSLGAALAELGFTPCYQMRELLSHPEQANFWLKAIREEVIEWNELFQDYQATLDFPSYRHYCQLLEYYPHAKVILTIRDPQTWYKSAFNTIYQVSEPHSGQQFLKSLKLADCSATVDIGRVFDLVARELWQKDFQGKFADKHHAISVFNQHIEAVKQNVPSARLLIYEISTGWESLCDFLNVPVPNKTFPHLNEQANFQERVTRLLSQVVS